MSSSRVPSRDASCSSPSASALFYERTLALVEPALEYAFQAFTRMTAVGISLIAIGVRAEPLSFIRRYREKPFQGGPPNMRTTALTLLIVFAPVSAALAQYHAGTPEEQRACSPDASRFCRKLLGDDNAVQQCLQQHRERLSTTCRKVFESHGM
jgi:hypothetical protein